MNFTTITDNSELGKLFSTQDHKANTGFAVRITPLWRFRTVTKLLHNSQWQLTIHTHMKISSNISLASARLAENSTWFETTFPKVTYTGTD